VIFEEKEKRVEGFGRELDWSSLTQELAPRDVYTVATEAVTTHLHGQFGSWTAAS